MRSERFRNKLLCLLSTSEFDSLAVDGKLVHIPYRTMLCRRGENVEHVFFPTSGAFSAVIGLGDGSLVEAAIGGSEGMTSFDLLTNDRRSNYDYVQQIEGEAIRLSATNLLVHLNNGCQLRTIMQTYLAVLLRQVAQTAACNIRHSLEKRMVSLLLQFADRGETAEFRMTQEFISRMLGVRRQSVNTVLSQYQQERLISNSRSRIAILDRSTLENRACECYGVRKAVYERLMMQLHVS